MVVLTEVCVSMESARRRVNTTTCRPASAIVVSVPYCVFTVATDPRKVSKLREFNVEIFLKS